MSTPASIVAVLLVTVATLVIGAYGLRMARTTSDFYVASRTVSPAWNASAISGEYLSAASFLGVAGLILAYGVDMLWYPVGYTAGYLILLLFVAAPLRRSGAYTLPDFAEARLSSIPVRRISSVLVVVIGWLYLVPQLQGASLTLHTVTGAPPWAGSLIVAIVVLTNVLAGGMRSITFVQAFQYWTKVTALLVPLVVVLLHWQASGGPTPAGTAFPTTREPIQVQLATGTSVQAPASAQVVVHGSLDGADVNGPVTLTAGTHYLGAGATVLLPAGTVVPQGLGASTVHNSAWLRPLQGGPGTDHPLYATYSLMLATFLGTMGLPHVLVRFYTNPDGRSARRATVAVLVLLSGFYLLPTVYGVLARVYTPDLLLTGRTDAAVLLLPARVIPGPLGQLLSALVTAGAFAAFLSTSSGLTVSVSGVLAQDVLRRVASVRAFRWASVVAVTIPYLISVAAYRLPVADAVGLAFAVAASSFCPLLLLGIWWRRLTDVGAATGLVVGGGLAALAVLTTILTHPTSGWTAALLTQPAAWCVPLAFTVMVATSYATRRRLPEGTGRALARMHTPESLSLRPDPTA